LPEQPEARVVPSDLESMRYKGGVGSRVGVLLCVLWAPPQFGADVTEWRGPPTGEALLSSAQVRPCSALIPSVAGQANALEQVAVPEEGARKA